MEHVEEFEGAPDPRVDDTLRVNDTHHVLDVAPQGPGKGTLVHICIQRMVQLVLVICEGTDPKGPVRGVGAVPKGLQGQEAKDCGGHQGIAGHQEQPPARISQALCGDGLRSEVRPVFRASQAREEPVVHQQCGQGMHEGPKH